jgi:hypothetical protein
MKQFKLIYAGIFVMMNLGLVSCAEPKIAQCQKIISFVNQVAMETKTLTNNQSEKNYQPWLQAADKMEDSAEKIDKLLIFDRQLKEYKTGFVQMYSDYAESTRDIIKARQNKDRNQALIAQEKVKKASQLEQELSKNINQYCLN